MHGQQRGVWHCSPEQTNRPKLQVAKINIVELAKSELFQFMQAEDVVHRVKIGKLKGIIES